MSENKLPERYENILEDLGWYYSYSYACTHNGEIDLEQFSPAGEDFIFTVSIDNFVEEVIDYAETFAPEDHAAQWISARYTSGAQGLPHAAILIEDAFSIQKMLKELANALKEKPQENFQEYETPILCGFVWKHGDKDYAAWEVQLKDEDRDAIESILEKYDTCGSSLRNCYDSLFSDVYS